MQEAFSHSLGPKRTYLVLRSGRSQPTRERRLQAAVHSPHHAELRRSQEGRKGWLARNGKGQTKYAVNLLASSPTSPGYTDAYPQKRPAGELQAASGESASHRVQVREFATRCRQGFGGVESDAGFLKSEQGVKQLRELKLRQSLDSS